MTLEFSTLITSNSFYDKPIETYKLVDPSIFIQIENHLSKLTNENEVDYLSPLLLLLLEHIPVEIDFNLLTSTETNYHQISLLTKKLYKPNLIPTDQTRPNYSLQSQSILKQLFQDFQVNNLEEFLQLKQNSQPIYFHCLHHLTPLLSKAKYHQYPLAIEVFLHIIKSLPQSSLTESFDFIFSVCLITLDDPSIDMKLIGLYVLDHLQRHCTSTELLLFNRANVIM